MSKTRSFTRGIIKLEDIDAARKGLNDPRGYSSFLRGLAEEEPGMAMGMVLFSVEEAEKFIDDVPPEVLEKIVSSLTFAMEVGYLVYKKAHDKYWEGIDLNSKI